jgi:hypothetical protein
MELMITLAWPIRNSMMVASLWFREKIVHDLNDRFNALRHLIELKDNGVDIQINTEPSQLSAVADRNLFLGDMSLINQGLSEMRRWLTHRDAWDRVP